MLTKVAGVVDTLMPKSQVNGYTFDTYPISPGNFDPSTASTADLALYGIPSFDATPPALVKRWKSRMVSPFQVVQPSFSQFQSAGVIWSGGIMAPRGERVTWVEGTWTIPTAALPAGAQSGRFYKASIWTRIDGHLTKPVFQAGCLLNVAPDAIVDVIPFFEWYPDPTIKIGNVPLSIGDELSLFMRALSMTSGVVLFCNVTQQVLAIFSVAASSPTAVLQLYGASAEWIVESGQIDAQFSPVDFTDCNAGDDSGSLQGTGSSWLLANTNPNVDAQDIDSTTLRVTHSYNR